MTPPNKIALRVYADTSAERELLDAVQNHRVFPLSIGPLHWPEAVATDWRTEFGVTTVTIEKLDRIAPELYTP